MNNTIGDKIDISKRINHFAPDDKSTQNLYIIQRVSYNYKY